jgi:hypothetical protein
MKHQHIKYVRAFLIMVFCAMFRVLLMLFSYWSILLMNAKVDPSLRTPTSIVFQLSVIIPILILFAEAVCYLLFRNRLFIRRFVRFHLWMSFISSVLFPILQFVGYIIIPFIFPSNESNAFQEFNQWGMFIGWFLFGIARFFFIIAMVKSVTSFNDQKQPNEPSGFLDDFAQ